MDIPATILDVAGVAHPGDAEGTEVAPLQGKSLGPVLADDQPEVRGPTDWIGWELFGNRAIRMGNWKLLWLCAPYGTGDWQLFDLAADPGETRRPRVRTAGHPRPADRGTGTSTPRPTTSSCPTSHHFAGRCNRAGSSTPR